MQEEILFGGLSALEADERIPMGVALTASDCVLDDGTIRGRHGYRRVQATAVSPNGEAPQHLGRYRPSRTVATTIVVAGGSVFRVSDPSDPLLSDGATTLVQNAAFAISDDVRGAQLGKYYYLANADTAAPKWWRVKPDMSIESIAVLPKGVTPSSTPASVTLRNLAALVPVAAGGAGVSALHTDWDQMDDGASGDCPVGGSLTYDLGVTLDLTAYNWLEVFATPPTQSAGWGKLLIQAISAGGTVETLGTMWDATGAGSPNTYFINLNTLTPATRATFRKVRFTMTSAAGKAGIYGVLPLPSAPGLGEQKYRVTFYNSTSKQESDPTDELAVVYSADGITFPTFHSVYGDRSSFVDGGTKSADLSSMEPARLFNGNGGPAAPDRSEFAPTVSIGGAVPTGCLAPLADKVRLWRLTESGWRLVKEVTNSGATYSIADDVGGATLSHQSYDPKGSPPAVRAMCAYHGRLITGSENRLTISDYVPAGETTDPFPQFSKIPDQEADGWAFDIAPSNVEQITSLVSGDVLYVLTNENLYLMDDVTPNAIPLKVISRGAVGPLAACWAEGMCFYIGQDGVYQAARADVTELSQSIRRVFADLFAPDLTACITYRNRKLLLWCGERGLRYDFVTERWTSFEIADRVTHATSWVSETAGAVPFDSLAKDTFTDAEDTYITAHTSDTGHLWERQSWDPEVADTVGIKGNTLTSLSGLHPDAAHSYRATPPTQDYTVSAVFTSYGTVAGGTNKTCIAARMSDSAKTAYVAGYQFNQITPALRGWFIGKWVAGVYTELGFWAVTTFGTNASYDVRFECTDAYKRLYVNGVLRVASADNTITDKGHAGVMGEMSRSYGYPLNEFSVDVPGVASAATGNVTFLLTTGLDLMNWQDGCDEDGKLNDTDATGTAIPAWVYITGYDLQPTKYFIDTLFADVTGTVRATAYNSSGTTEYRYVDLSNGEQEIAFSADFSAYKMRLKLSAANAVQVRRLMWRRSGLDTVGNRTGE